MGYHSERGDSIAHDNNENQLSTTVNGRYQPIEVDCLHCGALPKGTTSTRLPQLSVIMYGPSGMSDVVGDYLLEWLLFLQTVGPTASSVGGKAVAILKWQYLTNPQPRRQTWIVLEHSLYQGYESLDIYIMGATGTASCTRTETLISINCQQQLASTRIPIHVYSIVLASEPLPSRSLAQSLRIVQFIELWSILHIASVLCRHSVSTSTKAISRYHRQKFPRPRALLVQPREPREPREPHGLSQCSPGSSGRPRANSIKSLGYHRRSIFRIIYNILIT